MKEWKNERKNERISERTNQMKYKHKRKRERENEITGVNEWNNFGRGSIFTFSRNRSTIAALRLSSLSLFAGESFVFFA